MKSLNKKAKEISQDQYIFNVKKCLSIHLSQFNSIGFNCKIEQSNRSNSCYIILEAGSDEYKVRISDHNLPVWCEKPDFLIHDIISKNGEFYLNKLWFFKFNKMMNFYRNNFIKTPSDGVYKFYQNGQKVSFHSKDEFIKASKEIGLTSFYMLDNGPNLSFEHFGEKYTFYSF